MATSFFFKQEYYFFLILFSLLFFLQVLDIHSTKISVDSGCGYEKNELYRDNVNSNEYGYLFLIKALDLLIIFLAISVIFFASSYILFFAKGMFPEFYFVFLVYVAFLKVIAIGAIIFLNFDYVSTIISNYIISFC